ncbi:MAG: hypothetical protein K9W45_10980 [Candidatus Heimdallarchaeum aukensis]|uniref:OB domain-containing protein n=2 Tax=Candidatus Heimdallarchaeum TaxID=3053649 RepID=A0A9Y1BQF8_9ARCH|nr:MAG: hypothetical protein DRN69_07095 [Candidatus Pacearchaeota archaeon]UJG40352.1 MAG: hypothetical protein K9W45_10980 [Candidatus Heimdallarchaeum aukensis]UJG43071.1 MAG: hypothetical protein K9W46_11935 [Candidatus Heimdallarchaeum endolithica]
MKINELKANSNFDEIKARIISKQGPRKINSRGRWLYAWDLLLVDQTGSTVLTLWGPKAGEDYKVGQVVSIVNGWCKEYLGKKQISLGREGKIYHEADDPSIPRSIPES